MTTTKEKDPRLDMLRGMLAKGEPIWRQMAPEIRPDTARVAQSLTIGKITTSRLPIHPRLPVVMREEIERNIRASDAVDISQLLTHTDGISGRTTITERALMLREESLARIMYYHAAADRLLRLKRRGNRQFTPSERSATVEIVQIFHHMGVNFTPDGIVSLGYRGILMEGQYAITEIEHPDVANILNNLFPTAMEIVTEGIAFHGGNVSAFVKHLREGIVGLSPIEDHPTFAFQLYYAMHKMEVVKKKGWQDLLIALGSGRRDTLNAKLDRYTGSSWETAEFLFNLQSALQTDENRGYRAYA